MTDTIRSVSISGRLTLDMHSLNNEGGEGNQIQTRMVNIVDGDGNLHVVNAISGDMLKHIQAEHFVALAGQSGGALRLCAGCQRFSANRINDDKAFLDTLGKDGNEAIVTRVIQHCAVDDVEGVLITVGNRSAPRKSAIEFGWALGLPDKTRTESYFHVKYVPERGQGSGDESGANVGQNIFYRPASSGVYALVCTIELHRVGWNDIARQIVVADESERRARQRALLQSALYTLVRTNGAQRNTQHPHVLGFEGVVAWSTTATPAPTVSALVDDYVEQIVAIGQELNRLDEGAVTSERVESGAALARVVADLAQRI